VEQARERVEDFVRRYWHGGNRVFRVLAVAATVLLRDSTICATLSSKVRGEMNRLMPTLSWSCVLQRSGFGRSSRILCLWPSRVFPYDGYE
jgi:hypothetical protein